MAKGLERMRRMDPVDLLGRLRKDRILAFRLAQRDLDELKATAKALGLTATDYILSLHRIARDLIGPRLVLDKPVTHEKRVKSGKSAGRV